MDPARIFTESLTPRPELENSQGSKPEELWSSKSSPLRPEEPTWSGHRGFGAWGQNPTSPRKRESCAPQDSRLRFKAQSVAALGQALQE
jgi:hypothetical protein